MESENLFQKQILNMLEKIGERFDNLEANTEKRFDAQEEQISLQRNEFLLATPGVKKKDRRESDFFATSALQEGGSTLPGLQTVATPREIPVTDMVSTISIAAMMRLKGRYREFQRVIDPTKKLIHFFPEKLAKSLVDSERRLRAVNSHLLHYDNIYLTDDRSLMSMVARFVRPLTGPNYLNSFVDNVYRPKPIDRTWKFGISEYDTQIHTAICNFAEQCKTVYEILETDCSTVDKQLWPMPNWGKSSEQGLLRTLHELLGDYKDNFTAAMTNKKLEKMASLDEYLDLLKEENDRMCTEAIQQKKLEARVVATPKASEQVKVRIEENARRRFASGRDQNHSRLKFADSSNKLTAIDDSFQEEDYELMNDLNLVMSGALPEQKRNILDPKSIKVKIDELQACYAHFGADCSKNGRGCPYDHSITGMHKHRDKLFKQLAFSRYAGPKYIDEALVNFKSHRKSLENQPSYLQTQHALKVMDEIYPENLDVHDEAEDKGDEIE